MPDEPTLPVLYVLACGARPAAELRPFVTGRQRAGWQVCVVATPSALGFLDAAELSGLTGHPVRSAYKRPDEPDVLPPAEAMVVAPATFNTVNKMSVGHSDTLVLGLVNEAIGLGLPVVVAPAVNRPLARHPVFADSLSRLESWGVRVVHTPDRLPPPNSPPGPATWFPWTAVAGAVDAVRPPRPGAGTASPA